jgi:DNA-binding SARP family transcriptional activator/tetratricopeptide (TPR) repeat protein
MDFGLLGPVRALSEGRPVDLGSRKQRLVLAVLLLDANRFVATSRLVRACWPDEPPPTARRIIHTHVSRLRSILTAAGAQRYGVSLVRHGSGYVLTCDPTRIDAHRFRGLVNRARADTSDEQKTALLGQALDLWQGSPLADAAPEATRHWLCPGLEETRLTAIADRLDARLRLGQHVTLIDELVGYAAEHPLQQRIVGQLMLALYRAGRAVDALEVYQQHRRRLVDEFGVDPCADLRQLELAILRADPALDLPQPAAVPRASEELDPAVPVAAELPADVADFTGRDGELRRLHDLPSGTTVVTITGTAGVGKTALAVHWGHRIAGGFGDGQLYVDLRGYAAGPPVSAIEALAQFLRALGVPAERVPTTLDEAAARYRSLLAGKRMLIVLDNARSPEQVRPLLPGSATCLVVITSRNRLGGLVAREGARAIPLTVLDPPQARALLAGILGDERVRAEPEGVAELARLCAHLPLALRIAGANLLNRQGGTIAGLLAELGERSRLGALEIDGDDLAAVRATFDLSYAALPPAAARLFRLLGLDPGPDITAPAAAALAGTTPEAAARLLDALAGVHLLEQRSPGRYHGHDLLRLYARERTEHEDSAAEREAAMLAMADWYLHSVDAAAEALYPQMLRLPTPPSDFKITPVGFGGPGEALRWLDSERANLVALIVHSAAHGSGARAWQLADALRGYFWLRRYTVDWLAVAQAGSAAATVDGDLRGQAAAELSLADAYQCLGRCDEAIGRYKSALALTRQADWPEGRAAAMGNLGIMHYELGRLTEAADHYSQALDLHRRTGRRSAEAVTLGNLATVHRELGRLWDATEQYREALMVLTETGSRYGQADATGNLGIVCHELGQLEQALRHLDRALAMHQEIGERYGEAITLSSLAAVHRDLGHDDQAFDLARAALVLAQEIGSQRTEAEAMIALASVECRAGQHHRAVDRYQHALGMLRETGALYPQVQALIGLATGYRQLGHLDQAHSYAGSALALARDAGLRVLEGQALSALAEVHLARNEPAQAINYATRALAIHRATGHRLGEAATEHLLDPHTWPTSPAGVGAVPH